LPYVTEYHWLSAAGVRDVQLIPLAVACDTTPTLNKDARITAITVVRKFFSSKFNHSSSVKLG
jgi:hypothetical protein